MSGKYNIVLEKSVYLPRIKKQRKQFSFVRKDKKMIDVKDVEKIFNELLKGGVDSENISILGLNAERLTTIKSFSSGNAFDYFDDDYLNGKSSDIQEKLSKFFSIQVIIY
jgi:hypothetical protein